MSTYIAFTIGPIDKIISYARKTKELWASSYLFSYIGEQLVRPFYLDLHRTFLLPFLFDEMFSNMENKGIGIFPDRYIFKSEPGDFGELQKNCNNLYNNLATNITVVLNKENKSSKIETAKVVTYLKHTIKIYAFEKEFDDEEDVTKKCEQILTSIENNDVYANCEERNYLRDFFQNVADSFLTKDAMLSSNSRIFKSIREYSAAELRQNKEFTSDSFWDNNKSLRPYHNYIAFVKADGDNFTTTIKSLKEKNLSIDSFNKALYNYNTSVASILREYGGRAIFIGGDDLLFFVPVLNQGEHVFSLISKIDEVFKGSMKGIIDAPTLSFGLSMTYYKFPMSEAIENAESLLEKAKNSGKNHLCWQLVRHSGQIYEGSINKKHDTLKQIIDLINNEDSNKKDESKKSDPSEEILNSYTYWMMQNKEMIMYILQPFQYDTSRSELAKRRLKNYINNSLNETIHANMGDYVDKLVDNLVSFMYTSNNAETGLNLLCAILHFVSFLKSKSV